MSGNNPDTAAMPYDIADLPLLYEALSLGVATAVCSSDPAGRAALEPYANGLRALMPAIAFHFEPSDWSAMIRALRVCSSWSVAFDSSKVRHRFERDEDDFPRPVPFSEIIVRAGEGAWRTRDALGGEQNGLSRDRLYGFRQEPEILRTFEEALAAYVPLEARFEEQGGLSEGRQASKAHRPGAS